MEKIAVMNVPNELRELLPTWAVVSLLPVPMSIYWQSGPGRDFSYGYLFLGCAILVAERFGRSAEMDARTTSVEDRLRLWHAKITALLLAVTGLAAILTAFVWAQFGYLDTVVPLFSLMAALPAIGCVPYIAIKTGKPYMAVMFTAAMLGAVKIAGCVVARIVYGPHALSEGYMTLPWQRPNLLVWLCLTGAAALSMTLYVLGRQAFLKREIFTLPQQT